MKVDLHEVRERPFRWEETREIPAERLDRPGLLELSPIEWAGEVRAELPDFLLTAGLAYRQTLACTRCLEPIEAPVDGEVEMTVRVDPEAPPAGEFELHDEDFDLLTVGEETLDLDALLMEQLQLAVPMRVLCRPDCQGLCPVCGGNRNEEACDCVERRVDPRWAGLAALVGDDSENR